jgi:sugar lactone lactonase YvrE
VTVVHRLAIAALALITLVACVPPASAPADDTPLVWPPEPAPPRLAFVRAFSRPDDLGIAKSLLQKLADVLFGGSEARLVRPMAVVAAGTTLFVADPGAKGVHRLDPAEGKYELIGAEGGVPLASPVALARGADGEIYVSDSARGRVYVLRPGAKAMAPLELGAVLRQPTGIAYDRVARRLIVVDTAAHQIHFFNPDGSLAASVGRRGSGDGEFNFPTLLWRAPDGRLYVTDSLNFRIQILDAQGAFLSKFGKAGDASGDLARQKGVATDRYGHIYVVDALFNAVQIFDPSGRYLLSVGDLGTERGEFWLPTGIFITEDDTIYIADSYNRRVQVLRYIGGPA